MRSLRHSRQFVRDLERVKRSGQCTLDEIGRVIALLRDDVTFPPRMRDHPLKGEWAPSRDCHIRPDVVLIYSKVRGELQLRRVGSHSQLFG